MILGNSEDVPVAIVGMLNPVVPDIMLIGSGAGKQALVTDG